MGISHLLERCVCNYALHYVYCISVFFIYSEIRTHGSVALL